MPEDTSLKNKQAIIPLEKLREEPYVSIICYPKPSKAELNKRLKELVKLGITAIEFSGEKQAFNVSVLGKGCVGIVVIGYRKGEKVALKIRRVDADRARMKHEAEMLTKANSVDVGPRFLTASRNFLLMQLIKGSLLPDWLDQRKGKTKVKRVCREILEQCWRLDDASLDHGELSHAPKHVIVDLDEKPVIVDFETASLARRPSNVTSICQFLLLNGETARKVAEKIGKPKPKAIIEALKRYKNDRSRENFRRLLKVCGF
jgi:putative serine/threonine protein kinase